MPDPAPDWYYEPMFFQSRPHERPFVVWLFTWKICAGDKAQRSLEEFHSEFSRADTYRSMMRWIRLRHATEGHVRRSDGVWLT